MGTNLGELFKDKGIFSGRDFRDSKNRDILKLRIEDKDLVFIKWDDWKQFLKNHDEQFNDPLLVMTNEGIYTSYKLLSEIDYDKLCLFEWKDPRWEIKNLVESTKANSLLDLMKKSKVKPIDSKITNVLSEISNLDEEQIYKILTTIIENVIANEITNSVDNNKLNKLKRLNKLLGEIHG